MKAPQTQPSTSVDFLAATRRTGSIKPMVLTYVAYRNLWAKKMRTMLTISGVIIGIGSIVFLISLGFGLQKVVSQQVVDSNSIKTIDVTAADSKNLRLTSETVGRIRGYGHVSKVARAYASGGTVSVNAAHTDSVVFGADSDYLNLSSLRLVAGKTLVLSSNMEALVNKSLLSALGVTKPEDALGKTLTIKIASLDPDAVGAARKPLEAQVKVMGVLETGAGAEIFVRDGVFATAGATRLSQLKVVVDKQEHVPAIRKQIDGLGFTTASPIDTLDQITQIFSFFNFILAGFGGIGMTIAVLGMFNTLTISLLERTREIGLMVSLGARKRDIQRLFVIEALCLSFGGGVLGLLVAVLIGKGIDFFLTRLAASRGVTEPISIFHTPPEFVLGILLFVGLVGLVVVYYPARRAARISPIDALRRE
jgi:putative ABC transport system permease protein